MLFFFFPGLDDIFVTNEMWDGPYYWNKEDLPEEWDQIFSFSQPALEDTPEPEAEQVQLPEPEPRQIYFD